MYSLWYQNSIFFKVLYRSQKIQDLDNTNTYIQTCACEHTLGADIRQQLYKGGVWLGHVAADEHWDDTV